jgi:hypothetical protein
LLIRESVDIPAKGIRDRFGEFNLRFWRRAREIFR